MVCRRQKYVSFFAQTGLLQEILQPATGFKGVGGTVAGDDDDHAVSQQKLISICVSH
jgi:hypothetical protein